MKIFLAYASIVAIAGLIVLGLWFDSKHARAQVRVSIGARHAPLRGTVVVRPVTTIPRFSTAIVTVPPLMPAPIEGRSWRWHRNFGWVALERAPTELLLPPDFVLPREVPYYQADAAPPCLLTCPHCGQPITLIAR